MEHAKRQLNREIRALKITGQSVINGQKNNLQQTIALLESYSYQRILERGFALVTNKNKNPVDTIEKLSEGMPISMQFKDGKANATIDFKSKDHKKKKLNQNTKDNKLQGNLL